MVTKRSRGTTTGQQRGDGPHVVGGSVDDAVNRVLRHQNLGEPRVRSAPMDKISVLSR